MRKTTRYAVTCLTMWAGCYLGTAILGCWLLGCGQCTERWPDGSCKSDSGPVMATDLEGVWCQEPDARGEALCLSVQQSLDGKVWYRWGSWHCSESGILTGGLEFSVVEGSCFGMPVYSASADWTKSGLEVFPDNSEPIRLEWQE